MPPITFVPAPVFMWGRENDPRTHTRGRPHPHQTRRPKRPRRDIPLGIRTELIDRLEAATAAGRLAVDVPTYAAILAALFPEDFPADADRPTPATATDTPPASVDRATVYKRRESRGESLWHPGDLNAVTDDKVGLLGVKLAAGFAVMFGKERRGEPGEGCGDDMEDDREAA